MLEGSESAEDEQTFIDIKVQNPTKEYGSYISYEIVLETNDESFSYQRSSTRRRYSDFRTLGTILSKQLPYNKLPNLPPKYPFKNFSDPEFIQERQAALQDFLTKLVSDRMYLSSKALHLFLQSTFSMVEIKDIMEGKEMTNGEIPKTASVFYDNFSSNQDEADRTFSNPTSQELSSNDSSACAILEPSSELNINSPLVNKKVSFCDRVTVAEVHIPGSN